LVRRTPLPGAKAARQVLKDIRRQTRRQCCAAGPQQGEEVSYWEWFKLIGLSLLISAMIMATA
jgi:hypothetical protein